MVREKKTEPGRSPNPDERYFPLADQREQGCATGYPVATHSFRLIWKTTGPDLSYLLLLSDLSSCIEWYIEIFIKRYISVTWGNISHPRDLFVGVYYGAAIWQKLTPISAFAYIIIMTMLTQSIEARYTFQV